MLRFANYVAQGSKFRFRWRDQGVRINGMVGGSGFECCLVQALGVDGSLEPDFKIIIILS
jgi:hypothetical protein